MMCILFLRKKMNKKLIYIVIISFVSFFLSSCSRSVPKKRLSEKEVKKTVASENKKVLEEKEALVNGLIEKLSEVEKKNSELRERVSALSNSVSSLQNRISSQEDDWNHRYFQQQMVLIIFQIYNYVQQEGNLPSDLSSFILDRDKWHYEKVSDTNFTLRSKVYPEIRYSGSISTVERIVRPPSEWKYVGRLTFQNEMVGMILNEGTGDTRFIKKGDWVETFQVEKITKQGIHLISPRGKSVIPYTGGG